MMNDGRSPTRTGHRIKVLLVDDHAVIRQALRMLLEAQPDLDVVADVENGREAVLLAEQLKPDVVLMDVVMPGLNGLEATRQIRKRLPGPRVVMLIGGGYVLAQLFGTFIGAQIGYRKAARKRDETWRLYLAGRSRAG
jgi:DNA-binding response OmpR family regulator